MFRINQTVVTHYSDSVGGEHDLHMEIYKVLGKPDAQYLWMKGSLGNNTVILGDVASKVQHPFSAKDLEDYIRGAYNKDGELDENFHISRFLAPIMDGFAGCASETDPMSDEYPEWIEAVVAFSSVEDELPCLTEDERNTLVKMSTEVYHNDTAVRNP